MTTCISWFHQPLSIIDKLFSTSSKVTKLLEYSGNFTALACTSEVSAVDVQACFEYAHVFRMSLETIPIILTGLLYGEYECFEPSV
jgi:hypothetical protein